ncbi:hypothetical protein ACFL27_13310 [candidate division CSSED10-310 bacterium]|uniref:4Fe-4S Mo/W bis-MGD-type domain-containing protein n=1 Tax=candidate division CSSED10-310 bacterium TaxID=2855610 RepID=A0ABV6YY92_UNCC1
MDHANLQLYSLSCSRQKDTSVNRRNFIKTLALQSALLTAQTLMPGIIFSTQAKSPARGEIKWKKTPCRFCGTGCGLLVGVSEERAVAVKGDPNCSVNKGLCCVKGYHSILALYGADRLRQAHIHHPKTNVR